MTSQSSSGKRKLLIDTDAGVDDAQAILMALTSPDVDVIGITCVAGNTDAHQVAKNVLRVLQVVDKLHIPVYVGCDEPLLGDKKSAFCDYHGSDGFGDAPDPNAPDISLVQSEHAVSALVRISKEHEGELTLVCIGPLTNAAMAIRMDPKFGTRLKDCYVMGGNHQGKGNVTPAAEFNFFADPEAAYVVLNQLRAQLTLVTWETCEAHTLSWEWFQDFHQSQTTIGLFLANLEKNIVKNFYQKFFDKGIDKSYEVVDQYAMGAAIFDDVIVDSCHVYATVDTQSPLTRGLLVVDWRGYLEKAKNVNIVTKELYNKLRSPNTPVTNFLRSIEVVSAAHAKDRKWVGFVPADEVLMACVLNSDAINTCCDVYASVECKGHLTAGQMVVDWYNVLKKPKNITAITSVNQNVFEKMLVELSQ